MLFLQKMSNNDDDQKDVFTKELSKEISKKAEEKAAQFADFVKQSFINAASVHKGNLNDYINFFNANSTDLSLKLFSYNDNVKGEDTALQAIFNEEKHAHIKPKHIVKQNIVPKPGDLAYDHFIKNADTIDRNWYQFTHCFDKKNNTIYFVFQATDVDEGKKGLNASLLGSFWEQPKLHGIQFPYNDVGGMVPKPFLEIYQMTRDTMDNVLKQYNPTNIVFTGHSQGASLATMAAADSMFKGKNLSSITFGEATVGDDLFFKGLNQNAGGNYLNHRIQHKHDPITIVGNYKHYDNKIWDISEALDFDPYKDKKFRIQDLPSFTGNVHSEETFINAVTNIQDGNLKVAPVAGEFVGKWKFDNIAKFMYKFEEFGVWDAIKFARSMYQDHGLRGLEGAGERSNTLKRVVDNVKKVLTRAGLNTETGAFVSNALSGKIFKNFEKAVVSRLRNTSPDLFTELVSNLDDEAQNKLAKDLNIDIADWLDNNIEETDQLDEVLDIHELLDKVDDFKFKDYDFSSFQRMMGQVDDVTEMVAKIGSSTNYLKLDPPRKFVPIAKEMQHLASNVISDDFKKNVKASSEKVLDNIEELLQKSKNYTKQLGELKIYNQLDEGVKPTLLNMNIKLGPFNDISIVFKNNIGDVFNKINPIKGISGVRKNVINSIVEKSNVAMKNSLELITKLNAKSLKFGKNAAVMASKLKKILTKSVPLIGSALEIGFTIDETIEDVDRIDDEKEFILWNGEIVFKLYNPEEYKQLSMLKIIYETQNLESATDFDTFVNTWYGRLSTTENGQLMIDGIKTNDPNFNILYNQNKLAIRGDNKDYSGESKTLSIIKNIGLGVFNIAMDLAGTLTVGGASAQVFTSVAIGVIDEAFEQQAINKKANGFNKALKFKILSDSYNEIVEAVMKNSQNENIPQLRDLIFKYFVQVVGKEKQTVNNMSQSSIEDLEQSIYAYGVSYDLLKDYTNQIKKLESLYDANPELIDEIASMMSSLPIGVMNAMENIGNNIYNVTNTLSGTLGSSLQIMSLFTQYLNLSREALNNYHGAKNSLKNVNYTKEYYDYIKELKNNTDLKLQEIDKLVNSKIISSDEAISMKIQIYNNHALNFKVFDVVVNPVLSKYKNDAQVQEIVSKYEADRKIQVLNDRASYKDTLNALLSKHSTTENNYSQQMQNLIAKAKTSYLFKINNIDTSDANFFNYVMEIMVGKRANTDSVRRAIVSKGINKDSFNTLVGNDSQFYSSEYINIENSIMQQYYYITRIMDVYYDEKSIYRNDADIIKYYKDNNIEIDITKRNKQLTDIEIQNAINNTSNKNNNMDQYLNQINTYEEDLQNLKTQFKNYIDENEKVYNESMQETRDQYQEQLEEKINNDSKGLDSGHKDTDVLEESDQFDLVLPYNKRGGDKFQPSGKLIPFTFDDGPPRMLFEDGREEAYTGPKNALSSSVTHGYWIGAIPNGSHAPINTIDNYFMAYHIESQQDPDIARLRFISRIKKALNDKYISPEKDLVEYEISVYTYVYLEKNQHLFGLEINNHFLRNGLGATINSQIYQDDRDGYLKGELPRDFNRMKFKDISIEKDVVNPLKRAADLALEIGDHYMNSKFQKISFESENMKRVANEYIDKLRQNIDNDNVNINTQNRLVLENDLKVDTLQEKYALQLISILNRKLFEFI